MAKVSKSNKVYNYIKRAVISQEYGPGAPISELKLSETLGISRTPVREAIQRLKAEKVLESVAGKGVYVKVLTREMVKANYEMMEALDGMCAYLIAESVDRKQIEKLKPYLEKMEALVDSESRQLSEWLHNDGRFHSDLYLLCPNKEISEQLKTTNRQILNMRLSMGPVGDLHRSTEEHRRLFEALLSGDCDEARNMAQNHWRRVRRDLLDSMDYVSRMVGA